MANELVSRVLKHVWNTLQALNIPMAVMGGIALSAWERVRATQDVDLLVDLGPCSADAVLQTLKTAAIRPKRDPPVLQVGDHRFVQLIYEPPGTFLEFQVDLLLADSPYQKQALSRRVPMRLAKLDTDVFVLTCEDLILHKLVAGRILDRADAAELLRANRATLDFGYLRHWIVQLNLVSGWSEVWQEAFPDEPTLLP
jgi:hypothetical protein